MKGRNRLNLKGKVFGRLTCLEFVKGLRSEWICKCACGKVVQVRVNHLREGVSRSCGCLMRESMRNVGLNNKVHGHLCDGYRTGIYASWAAMKARAFSHTATTASLYEDKAITINPLWVGDFVEFFKAMGKTWFEGAALHRIDPWKGYNKYNCVWLNKSDHMKVHRQLKKEGIYGK